LIIDHSTLTQLVFCLKILVLTSEDTKVDTPLLLASPPMHQSLSSVEVHTGPITYRKPSEKYPLQRAEDKILKITELSGLATHSYEAWSEPVGTNQQSGAETHSQQQEARQKFARADSDMDMQVHGRLTLTENQAEDHEVFYRKGAEVSSCRGNTVSDSDANKRSNADQADVQNSASGEGDEDNMHHENENVDAPIQLFLWFSIFLFVA